MGKTFKDCGFKKDWRNKDRKPKKKTFKINYRVLSKEELENLEEPLIYHQYMILEKEKQESV